ncbi:MAG TPA: hypothetical protein VGN08_02905 [Solirubrobacteraceae bacterium]|jgi:Tfp pilus assembly protein PilP
MLGATAKACCICVLTASVLALAACGESSEEKAKAQVCSSRAEISKEITKLQSLTLSSNTPNEVKTSLETIKEQLTKIKDAQPKLEASRKEQVETATNTFETQLKTIASGVGASLSAGNLTSALAAAGPKVKEALSSLATSYRQTLGPISCS